VSRAGVVAAEPLDPKLKQWRARVFASTWLSYVGFYFCRKPFYIVKSDLGEAMGWDAASLGLIGSAYLAAYTVGQFLAGWSGTKFGPRKVLILGMAGSVLCNIAFGFSNSVATFAAFMALNGLAQATGWSNNVGTMGNWFRRQERGTVMGFWATCFQWGGVFANGAAAWVLGRMGFQYSFFAGSLVLSLVLLFFLFNQRDKPEDVGLVLHEVAPEDEEARDASGRWSKQVITTVLIVGVFYFFVKFIRYALWSWAPFFLSRNYGLEGDDAGYFSTIFDFAGIFGVIAAGYLSDRFFSGRRAKISFYFLLLMIGSTVVMYVGGQAALVLFGISLALVGFTLYGPDALMTGAAAQDIGGKQATLAAGIINGMGAIGSVVQDVVIGGMYEEGGGNLGPIFAMLVGAAVLAAVALAVVLVRNRMGVSDV
jgi:sugar phosphate permease